VHRVLSGWRRSCGPGQAARHGARDSGPGPAGCVRLSAWAGLGAVTLCWTLRCNSPRDRRLSTSAIYRLSAPRPRCWATSRRLTRGRPSGRPSTNSRSSRRCTRGCSHSEGAEPNHDTRTPSKRRRFGSDYTRPVGTFLLKLQPRPARGFSHLSQMCHRDMRGSQLACRLRTACASSSLWTIGSICPSPAWVRPSATSGVGFRRTRVRELRAAAFDAITRCRMPIEAMNSTPAMSMTMLLSESASS
jgi:hypothetical protein